MAGTGGGSPCATPCSAYRQGRGAPGFPGDVGNGRRMEVRRGAIRVFSGNPFPAAAPRSPPFRLDPMRDPANPPLARTCAGTPPAFSRAQASPERASGVRGGRLRCACGRRWAPGWGRGWRDRCLPKNADGPLPHVHPSAVPEASTHAWSNPRPPPCPDTLPLHRGSSPLGERDAQFAIKSTMNLFFRRTRMARRIWNGSGTAFCIRAPSGEAVPTLSEAR
jgi:hypothetical protein